MDGPQKTILMIKSNDDCGIICSMSFKPYWVYVKIIEQCLMLLMGFLYFVHFASLQMIAPR